ncbi:MAG: hypothetical protein JEZ00_11340 [Anaerolineaceae bacterium]|nr:hypothetical protein [Anaerolineaceae bacterium]
MTVDVFVPQISVSVQRSTYLVQRMDDPFRVHVVDKNKTCSCGDPHCWSILAVADYLRSGGQRAPMGLPACPICGSETFPDRKWDGKYTKQPGWRCATGGIGHFLQAKTQRIRQQWAENPWLIPPASGYPGVRRDELMTWQECEAAEQEQHQSTKSQVELEVQ